MQGLSIFTKVFSARHKFTHLFKNYHRAATDLRPCPIQTVDGRCTESGNNGGQCREVVELATFLDPKVSKLMYT